MPQKVRAPRSEQGQSHPFATILAEIRRQDWGVVWTVLSSMALSLAKLDEERRKNAQGNQRTMCHQTRRNGNENRIQKKKLVRGLAHLLSCSLAV